MNKVILIGNLGTDPEVKNLDGGNSVATFSMATSKKYKSKTGESVTDTQWHNIEVFGVRAEVVGKYLSKGKKVAVEGELRTNTWDGEDGKKNYKTVIRLTNFEFLSAANDAGASDTPSAGATGSNPNNEDDLPF
jgi:single-strand DNA-binding protein